MRVYSLIYSVTMVNIVKNPKVALLNEPVFDALKHVQILIHYVSHDKNRYSNRLEETSCKSSLYEK